nr:D291 [uncultured bacterium]
MHSGFSFCHGLSLAFPNVCPGTARALPYAQKTRVAIKRRRKMRTFSQSPLTGGAAWLLTD